MSHEVETMVSVKETPWHGLGKVVESVMTAAECISQAGLAWSVMKSPLYVGATDGSYVPVEDRYAVIRDSDTKVLGVVGKDYQVFQNSEAFEFFDNLVDSGEAKYETAGSLYGGKRIWLTAKLPDNLEVAGGDVHELYILLSTSHDGSSAIRGDVTPVRVVCRNTQQLAFARAKMTWSVTHREGVQGKIAEAREALQLTFKGADSFKEMADKMASVQVTDDQFKAIMSKIFPEQKFQTEKNLAAVIANRHETKTLDDSIRMTGWGAFNAMTEWLDHSKSYRNDESRMKSLVGGWAQKTRSGVAAGILELAGK